MGRKNSSRGLRLWRWRKNGRRIPDSDEKTPGAILEGTIKRAYEKTGRQVAIIIDEYDAPLLDVLLEEHILPPFRKVMQEFYQPLKACEAMITINNLKNVTMLPKFSAICGFTETEVKNVFREDIERMAASEGSTRPAI